MLKRKGRGPYLNQIKGYNPCVGATKELNVQFPKFSSVIQVSPKELRRTCSFLGKKKAQE